MKHHRQWLLFIALVCATHAGCAHVVMFSKGLLGDPVQPSVFTERTGVKLTKGKHKTMVVCLAPEGVSADFDTLAFNLQGEVSRKLKRQGVDLINPDDVNSEIDRLGGTWTPEELADSFENVDYIIQIQVDQFSINLPNSQNLYKGHTEGKVSVFSVSKPEGFENKTESGEQEKVTKFVSWVFEQQFRKDFPGDHPVPRDQTPEQVFRTKFVRKLSDQLAQVFYDARAIDQ